MRIRPQERKNRRPWPKAACGVACLLLAFATPALAMGGGGGGGGGGSHGDGGMGSGGMGSGGMGNGMGSSPMHDHEMALKQHRSGMAPSLRALMRQIHRKYPGKVLDVRMVRDAKGSAYVFTIMQGNRIRQVRVSLPNRPGRAGGRSYNFNGGTRR